MRNRLRAGIFVLALVFTAVATTVAAQPHGQAIAATQQRPAAAPTRQAAYVTGELVVRYRSGTSARTRAALRRAAGSTGEVRSLALPRTEVVSLRPGRTVRAARRAIVHHPQIAVAEPNYYRYARLAPTVMPSRFGEQWSLANSGQVVQGSAGRAGADIRVQQAWDITQGSASTRIAVVDTGIDYHHPALRANVVVSPGGVSDFIDRDVDPYDFVNGHGTHVAGVIAAQGIDGGNVVTGINWRAQLLPVRVLRDDGSGTAADIIDGLAYAGRHARVVNASLGSSTPSRLERATIARYPNTLFVLAADNAGRNSDTTGDYPCDYTLPNIICVGASDSSDARASYSNWGGGSVDIAAPGSNVLSTLPGAVLFEENDTNNVATVPVDTDATNDDMTRWTPGRAANRRRGKTWGWSNELLGGERFTELADSPGASSDYAPNTNAWIASPRITLAGRNHCRLSFSAFIDTEPIADQLLIEASGNDGATWALLGAAESGFGNGTYVRRLPASAHTALARVRFRLLTDGSVNGDGAFVDAVRVSCGDGGGPWTADDSYGYESGTSMATPHVTGVAGLLFSTYPAASVSFVKQALLEGAAPHPEGTWSTANPATQVAAQGRLDARGALDAAAALGQELSPLDLAAPARDAKVLDHTPTFSWYPSGSIDGITGYRVYIDGKIEADLTNQRAVTTNGRISWRPAWRRRLAVGYHSWKVVAYQGDALRASAMRPFKVTARPRIQLELGGSTSRAARCGATPKRACAYRRRGVVLLRGTIGESRFTEGAVVQVNVYRARNAAGTRYGRRAMRVVKAVASNGRFPGGGSSADGAGLQVRLPPGRYRVRARAPMSDILLASNSPYRYVRIGR